MVPYFPTLTLEGQESFPYAEAYAVFNTETARKFLLRLEEYLEDRGKLVDVKIPKDPRSTKTAVNIRLRDHLHLEFTSNKIRTEDLYVELLVSLTDTSDHQLQALSYLYWVDESGALSNKSRRMYLSLLTSFTLRPSTNNWARELSLQLISNTLHNIARK